MTPSQRLIEVPSGDERMRQQLRDIVLARIEQGRYVVPPMPDVAVRCLELTRLPLFGLRDATCLLERDSALAAQVVRQANSPVLGAHPRVRTIDQALMRVGIERLRTVLVEACARRVSEIKDPRIARAFRGLWEHSLAVAVLARELCPLGPGMDREAAYLAGLLHDLGKPIVARILLDVADDMAGAVGMRMEASEWLPVVFRCHRTVGTRIAETWRMPSTVAQVIANAGHYDARRAVSIGNVVRLAHAVARREGFDLPDGEPADDPSVIERGCALLGVEMEAVAWLAASLKQRLGFDGDAY